MGLLRNSGDNKYLGMEIEDKNEIRVKGCVMMCNTSNDNLPDAGCNCDDIYRPSGIGSDSQCNWPRCLDFDLSTRSRIGH